MRRSKSRTSLSMDIWALGMEASTVIGLRSLKMIMGGAAAEVEAKLMVDEKIKAALAMQTALMMGKLGSDPVRASGIVVKHYRRKVRANRQRLNASLK